MRRDPRAVRELFRFFEEGVLELLPLGPEALGWFPSFFARFSDREPQIADASLIYLAEREGIEVVFTLDSRDFSVYRTGSGKALRIVPT